MPVAFWVMVFAGLSMAGVPPLLGFPAKEAAIEASLKESYASGDLILAGVTIGSVLTVAYTTRLVLALFSDKGGEPIEVAPFRWAAAAPSVLLSALGVVGYVWRPVSPTGSCQPPPRSKPRRRGTRYFGGRASTARPFGSRWASSPVVRSSVRQPPAIRRRPNWSAPTMSTGSSTAPSISVKWTTGRVQHGSLPIYLVVMALVASLAVIPFLGSIDADQLHPGPSVAGRHGDSGRCGCNRCRGHPLSDRGRTRARRGRPRRIGLFLIQGHLTLALTQLLVETVIVVGFVIGLGGLTTQFPANGFVWRSVRIGTAVLAGTAVTVALLASAEDTPSNREALAAAVDEGGGNNLVNVILTDLRALDTLGEVVVLVVARWACWP